YRLPRLLGQGTSLSRLGGGIGTRGPGETKLQSDRRHIMRRIHYLEAQLKEVSERRNLLRKDRIKRSLPVIAVVGYTNAGKSTLVNALCNSEIFAEDMLFATLDPSVRKLVTPEKKDFLLVDTVGFIKKLPHELVEAFKSTLEEAVYADLLLHVVDGSNPEADAHIDTVKSILNEIGAGNRPEYLVVNKIDKMEPSERFGFNEKGVKTFFVSAKQGDGLDELRSAVTTFFTRVDKNFELLIPYGDGRKLSYLHDKGTVLEEEYREDGVYVKGRIPREFWIYD
ncbi:MAG: GTPase HflX, partial [Clostridia bacterium]|nr:GTPase HflX [Clostridia bacterium]